MSVFQQKQIINISDIVETSNNFIIETNKITYNFDNNNIYFISGIFKEYPIITPTITITDTPKVITQNLFKTQNFNLIINPINEIQNINCNIIIASYNIMKLKNLLPVNKKILRLGIQGPAGTPISINGVKICIPKTGLYEINHQQIDIKFLGLTPIDNYSLYLIDMEMEE